MDQQKRKKVMNRVVKLLLIPIIFGAISCRAQQIVDKYHDLTAWSSTYNFTEDGSFYFNTSSGSVQTILRGLYKVEGDSIYLEYNKISKPKESKTSIEKLGELDGIILYFEVTEGNNIPSPSIAISYSIDSTKIISAYTDQNGELTLSLNEVNGRGSLDISIIGYENIHVPINQLSEGIWNIKVNLVFKKFNYPHREPESFYFKSYPDRLVLQNDERTLELVRSKK